MGVMRDADPVNGRGQVSRRELRRLGGDVARLNRMTVTAPLEAVSGGGGTHVRDAYEDEFLARITGRTPPAPEWEGEVLYAWEPVVRYPDGTYTVIPGLAVSTIDPPEDAFFYAVERNGLIASEDQIVLMRRAGPNYFDFDTPAFGSDILPPNDNGTAITVVTDFVFSCPSGTMQKTRKTYRGYVTINSAQYPVVFYEV
jgi:hypothetical protein